MLASERTSWRVMRQVLVALISIQTALALLTGRIQRQAPQGKPETRSASQATLQELGLKQGDRVQCRSAPCPGKSAENEPWYDGNIAVVLEEVLENGKRGPAVVMVRIDGSAKPVRCDQVRKLDYYLFEWVGFEENDRVADGMPRSPHYAGAKCLTAGGYDALGGRSLYWTTCMDTTVVTTINNHTLRKAQEFKLNDDGTVTSRDNNLCIRRMKCQEGDRTRGYVYDLGTCRDDISTKVGVRKPQANSMKYMRDMGYIAHAVRLDDCSLCGAYEIKNICLGDADCGHSWQAKPGWTKLASNYVGIDAVMGRSKYGNAAGGLTAQQQAMGLDFSGFGETRQKEGICGTQATDSPTKKSFYYLLKADEKYSFRIGKGR